MGVLSSVDISETGAPLIILHMSCHLLTTRKATVLQRQQSKTLSFSYQNAFPRDRTLIRQFMSGETFPVLMGTARLNCFSGGASSRLFLPPLSIINSMTSKKPWMLKTRNLWPARNVTISTKPFSLLWKSVKVLLYKIHIPANGLMKQLLLTSGLMACLTSLFPVGVLLFVLGKCSESCQTSSPSHLRFYLLHLRQILHHHGIQCLL